MNKRFDILKKKLWKTLSNLITDVNNERSPIKKMEMLWIINDLIEKILLLEWKATVIKKDIKITKNSEDDWNVDNIDPNFMVDVVWKDK